MCHPLVIQSTKTDQNTRCKQGYRNHFQTRQLKSFTILQIIEISIKMTGFWWGKIAEQLWLPLYCLSYGVKKRFGPSNRTKCEMSIFSYVTKFLAMLQNKHDHSSFVKDSKPSPVKMGERKNNVFRKARVAQMTHPELLHFCEGFESDTNSLA